METIVAKAAGSGGTTASGRIVNKEKKKKEKKSVLQLSMELIPDGKYAGLSSILEPHELRGGK